MFFFDPTYVLVIIAIIITAIASSKMKSTYGKYSKVQAQCGWTGRDVAKKILASNGIYGVEVNMISGELTDHYDPAKKVLNLSSAIYNGTSIASLGVAAHECGHAIQDSVEYKPLRFRSTLCPVANFGSSLAIPMILIGIVLGTIFGSTSIAPLFMKIGVIAYSLAVLFQLVTLPVEYNASDRALKQLVGLNILTDTEEDQAQKVLRAAALTYVAAALSSLLQLLRLIIIARSYDRD